MPNKLYDENSIQKTAGKHPITKEKLRWEFYNE